MANPPPEEKVTLGPRTMGWPISDPCLRDRLENEGKGTNRRWKKKADSFKSQGDLFYWDKWGKPIK